jgi:hypothetical protein
MRLDVAADIRPVLSLLTVGLLAAASLVAGCSSSPASNQDEPGRWMPAADAICARWNVVFRRDLHSNPPNWRTDHPWSPRTGRYLASLADHSAAMTDELTTMLKPIHQALADDLVTASTLNAEGWKSASLAFQHHNRVAFGRAIVALDEGANMFTLLSVIAGSTSCTDDDYTIAGSSTSERTAYRAFTDARWMCTEPHDPIPTPEQDVIANDLRLLTDLVRNAPDHLVQFEARAQTSLTYRTLAMQTVTVLGQGTCANDPAALTYSSALTAAIGTASAAPSV